MQDGLISKNYTGNFCGIIVLALLGCGFPLFFCFSVVPYETSHYELPLDHPIRPFLDTLFSSSRVTLNLHTLVLGGFQKAKPRKYTKLIVTKHLSLPGYVFKLYLDVQRYHKNQREYIHWINRIQGAEKIRNMIASSDLEQIFKVPKKWMYKLPEYPRPPNGYYLKQYILVEEDMNLISAKENTQLWKSSELSTYTLDCLFDILHEIGLSDCAKPDNIPFSRDGRIAFIDTQTFGCKRVDFNRLIPFLSKNNQEYWKNKIDTKRRN